MTTMNMPDMPPEHHHDSEHIYFTADQMLVYGKACAVAEREACAKICDRHHDQARTSAGAARADACATAIRTRKDTK